MTDLASFERLNTLASEIAEEILQRRRLLNPANPPSAAQQPQQTQQQLAKLTATIQRKLKQLEAEIALKDEELRKGGSRNQRDYHNKSGQLAVLSLRHEELRDEFLKEGGTLAPAETGGGVVSQLFTSKGEKALAAANAKNVVRKEELLRERTEDLLQRKERLLAEQDKGIELLSETVARQKDIAINIGGEVGKHNDLLDKMTGRVDYIDLRV